MFKIVTTALILSSAIAGLAICAMPAHSQEAEQAPVILAEVTPAKQAPSYGAVLATCGAQWKASEARKAVPKGEGRTAWNVFRARCVSESGYQAARRR